MAVSFVPRPPDLDGCWSSWEETSVVGTIRSEMEDGLPKARRRFTAFLREATVSRMMSPEMYREFRAWFEQDCQAGLRPTAMTEPDGTEAVWRFVGVPQYSWARPGTPVPRGWKNAVTVTCSIERLPQYQDL